MEKQPVILLDKFHRNGGCWTTADGILAAAELRRLHELSLLVKEFFENYLNVVEESESGKAFNPVGISCCRALMLQPLDNLLHRMRVLSGAKPNPIGDYDE